jgi:hypothetical protein
MTIHTGPRRQPNDLIQQCLDGKRRSEMLAQSTTRERSPASQRNRGFVSVSELMPPSKELPAEREHSSVFIAGNVSTPDT